MIGEYILHFVLTGVRDIESQEPYAKFRDRILAECFPHGKPYVEILDLEGVHGIPHYDVRRAHTEYRVSPRFGNCKATFIIRPNLILATMYRVGFLLQKKSLRYPVEIVASFEEAFRKAEVAVQSLHQPSVLAYSEFQFHPNWVLETIDKKGRVSIGVACKSILFIRYDGLFVDPTVVGRTIALLDSFYDSGILQGSIYHRIIDLSNLQKLEFQVRLRYVKEVRSFQQRRSLNCESTFAIKGSHWLRLALKVTTTIVDLHLVFVDSLDAAIDGLNKKLRGQASAGNDFQTQYQNTRKHKVEIYQEDLDDLLQMFGNLAWTHHSNKSQLNFPVGHPLHDAGNTYNLFQNDYRTILLGYKREERKARQLAIKAKAASKAKSEFLANMSHEIRTPMNGMMGMLHLLLQSGLDPQQKQYAELVRESSESLLDLVNDVLDFSKIEAGKLELENIPFHLGDLIADMEAMMRIRVQDLDLQVHTKIDPDVPQALTGDPSRLRQVLLNLIGNAFKFTSQGSISLLVCSDHISATGMSTLRFRVIDTGMGIPKDKEEQIFQSFSQVDNSTTRRFGGSGLGLAICKSLVSMMGGTIGVSSTLGQGSEFWFTAQMSAIAASDLPDRSKGDSDLEPLGLRTEARALVVEDNIINQKVAKGVLAKLGVSCEVVANGAEAIEILSQVPFHIVLMDCMMPVMDGYEATKRIRAQTGKRVLDPNIPIVAMTANAMSEDREKALSCGMNDYISKPISIQKLRAILLKYLA
jgi:signal transduction histidine kinase/CheY-like chemotaxis protein